MNNEYRHIANAFPLKKFGKDPKPGKFSRTHRLWGKIGMWDMALTCITGLMVYVYGFVL